jgi:hypothetical protein
MCCASAAKGKIVCFVTTRFEGTFPLIFVPYVLTDIQTVFVDDIP